MAKMQSTLKNMLLSLTSIALVAAAALASVYMLTKEQIDTQKAQAEVEAQQAVLAGDENGTPIMVEVNGFGGAMKVMVGFAQDGTILGYKILEHQETPGLGSKADQWFQNADKPGQNIIGRQATGNFTVSKDGGDVDAITAATISSRAFLSAINEAYAQFMAQKGTQVECCTGATRQINENMQSDSCCHHHEGCCEHKAECCKQHKECCKQKAECCKHQTECCQRKEANHE